MKQQSQKKNKKLIAGAIFGMAAGLAAASVPVIIPLLMNGTVAKPSEENIINFIDEDPTIIDENHELILSDEQSVTKGEEYEIVVDTTAFQKFNEWNWGVAVGEINSEEEINKSIIDTVEITLDNKMLYENINYTIEEDEKGGKVVVGNPLEKQGLLRVKLKVSETQQKARFAISSYYVEPEPEQDWVWNDSQAQLNNLTLAGDNEYTFTLKNFAGSSIYKSDKLHFYVADDDSHYYSPLVGTEKVYYNSTPVSKTEPGTEGGYWFDNSNQTIAFQHSSMDRSDSFKISLKFDIAGREISDLHAIVAFEGEISEQISLDSVEGDNLTKTQSVWPDTMFDIKCNLSLLPPFMSSSNAIITIDHSHDQEFENQVIFDLVEVYVNQEKIDFSHWFQYQHEIQLTSIGFLPTDVIYLRNIQFTSELSDVDFTCALF